MASAKIGLVSAALAATLLAGCTGTRVGPMDSGPAPLAPAPAGVVENRPLPPPASPDQFPKAPEQAGTQVASLPAATGPAADAPDVTTGSVAGVWNVSVAGSSCRVATPQTKFGAGYRAGPLKCPAPADGIRSWNVSGKQLTFFDDGGNAVARLYASGAGRFDGQTSSGQPISLSR